MADPLEVSGRGADSSVALSGRPPGTAMPLPSTEEAILAQMARAPAAAAPARPAAHKRSLMQSLRELLAGALEDSPEPWTLTLTETEAVQERGR